MKSQKISPFLQQTSCWVGIVAQPERVRRFEVHQVCRTAKMDELGCAVTGNFRRRHAKGASKGTCNILQLNATPFCAQKSERMRSMTLQLDQGLYRGINLGGRNFEDKESGLWHLCACKSCGRSIL